MDTQAIEKTQALANRTEMAPEQGEETRQIALSGLPGPLVKSGANRPLSKAFQGAFFEAATPRLRARSGAPGSQASDLQK